MPKHINKLNGGLDKDTNIKDVANNRMRESVNMSLVEDEDYGAGVNMRGTLELNDFLTPGDNFTVLGSIKTLGRIDLLCNETYVERKGIVYFLYDDTNFSSIWFYDIFDNEAYRLFPDPADASDNELGWDATMLVDAFAYSDRGLHYVYFVDGNSKLRKIEVKSQESLCTFYPNGKELSVRPLHPLDPIELDEVITGGNLAAGTYQFAYRYWNRLTCTYSGWSLITNPIPVIPDDDGCTVTDGRAVYGGRIGTKTNKLIKLTLPTTDGQIGFNQYQLLVIPNNNGSKIESDTGILLDPRTYIGIDGISYTGLEEGITVNLAEIGLTVDDAAIIGANTITEKDGRVFIGNVKINQFDTNPLTFTKAYTIDQAIGALDGSAHDSLYKCESDTTQYRGHFRDEVYAYGCFIFDEYGNGIVKPLSFSNFGPTDLYLAAVTTGTVDAGGPTVYAISVADETVFTLGDLIELNGEQGVVTVIIPGEITVQGTFTLTSNGSIDILLGQRGNQGTSWAWKYAHRCMNQFSLFDESDNGMAIGLRIEDLAGWPSWAKGFEIVRREREKNIIGQTPHIPTIAVQGVSNPYKFTGNPAVDAEYDYNGDLDYFFPKLHTLGTARNIVRIQTPPVLTPVPIDFYASEWNLATNTGIPKLIFATPPEYMHNVDGESYDLQDSANGFTEIVDAVAWKKDNEFPLAPEAIQDGDIKVGTTFSALNREQYLYNREGRLVENSANVYQKKIQELTGFLALFSTSVERKIQYQLEMSLGHAKQVLPGTVADNPIFAGINLFGNVGELAAQQGADISVRAHEDVNFWPSGKNQRGLIIKQEEVLEDFSTLMTERRVVNNDNYFPLLTWTAHTNVYEEAWMESAAFTFDGNLVRTLNNDAVADNQICGGAYILNIKKGLDDDRYGNIEDSGGEWIRTGAYQKLTQADIDGNTPFTVDVWGGDCFISRFDFKIMQNAPKVVEYDPDEDELAGPGYTPPSVSEWSKTGAFQIKIEVLSLYLESEVNGAYENVVDRYPRVGAARTQLIPDWEYYYHPNYSNQNSNKIFLTKPELCNIEEEKLRTAVMWSEQRVRGTSGNPFNETEGFNRWKVNNIWILNGKYGEIIKVATLEDKALHIFQERKIAFQPVGVDEIQTLDGALISTGTGQVLGTGEFYLQVDIGCQNMQTIRSFDGRFYAIDAIRKKAYSFGSRGSGFKLISEEGMASEFNSYCNANSGSQFINNSFFAYIDESFDRYIIVRTEDKGFHNQLVWNISNEMWETEISTGGNPVLNGISEMDRVFWMRDGTIYGAFEGNFNEFFGVVIDSEFSAVVNYDGNSTKVFQVVQVNALNRVSSLVCTVYNEDDQSPDQITAKISLDNLPVNHQYFANKLVAVQNGYSRKLRGMAMVIKFAITQEDLVGLDKRTVVSAIITKFRKAYGL